MLRRLTTYYAVWYLTAANALQETFVNRWTNLLFMSGKIIRLGMTLLVFFLIKENISSFAGYTPDQMIMFFLTYQFIDTITQVFYRGVYIFSQKIRSGEFDFMLTKPISTLFQALTGRPDFNDALFIIPTTALSIWIALQLDVVMTTSSALWYGALLLNAFLIATALHILIMAVGVITTEIDGAVWIYRDLMQMGRFPVSIYLAPVRWALFFIVPVGMMITIPTEVLVQAPPTYSMALAVLFGISFFLASLRIWNWSLKQYSSASS